MQCYLTLLNMVLWFLIFRLEVANKNFLFTKPELTVHELYMNLFTVHELKLPDKKI